MPTYMEQPDPEMERIKQQLEYAKALRAQGAAGLEKKGELVGGVYIQPDNITPHINNLTAQYMDWQADKDKTALQEGRQKAEDEWLGKLPSMTQATPSWTPEQMEAGPTQAAPLGSREVNKPYQQVMTERQQWAGQAPPQSALGRTLKAYGLEQAMRAPEKMEAREDAQAAAEAQRQMQIDAATAAAKIKSDEKLTSDEKDRVLKLTLAQIAAGNRNANSDLDRQIKEARLEALKGKGDEKAEAKKTASNSALRILDSMGENIETLEKGGGLVDEKTPMWKRPLSYAANIPVVQEVQRAYGGENQAERDMLESRRMQLLTELKQAKGLSASEMNSNFELAKRLEALGGGRMNVKALKEILDDTRQLFGGERKYGGSRTASGKIEPVTPAPTGVPQDVWAVMTPEERAAFK